MGLASERHDVMSQETHAGTWIGFRQPVARTFAEAEGRGRPASTRDTNPGEVWEEAEFWIALTWRVDPDGSLGARRWYESAREPGRPIGVDEYFGDLFERVPGLPEAAAAEGLEPLAYMRRYGAFASPYPGQRRYDAEVGPGEGVEVEGVRRRGFPTPSRKLELWSETLVDWGWPEHALPGYVRSHVHWRELDRAAGEMALVPTFRLPTLIHTRSANAKWLQEISHANPLWIHVDDAGTRGIATGELVRVTTRIGHFVARAWVTQGIHPGTVACSHHLGRWHVGGGPGAGPTSQPVEIVRDGDVLRLVPRGALGPKDGPDPDTRRVWWTEAGVHQNLAFPVQPDPASGMHCWHQRVRVERAQAGDVLGEVTVDLARSRAVFEEWLALARPGPGPGGLRRPEWLGRPCRPAPEAYRTG
jgi:anaerobic selenocysteine-containing dehydrogenase